MPSPFIAVICALFSFPLPAGKLFTNPNENWACKYVNSYYPLPSGLFRDNLQHWLGNFIRLLNVQFTSNEGMSNDAPIHQCLQMLLQRQHFLLSYLKTLSVGLAWVWTYGLPLGMRSPNWGSIKMSNKPRSETSLFDSYCNNSVDKGSMHKYRLFICLYVSLFRTPSRFLANIRIWNDVPIPIRLSSSWWLWFEHWRMGIRRFGTIPQVPSSTQY